MKTLVLIDNNLDYDNRVKRHISAMREMNHDVKVIYRPWPNATPGLKRDGVEMVLFPHPEITLKVGRIRELARRTQTTSFVFRAFPGAFVSLESFERLGPLSRRIQEAQIACSWWEPFRNATFQEGVAPFDEHQFVLVNFEDLLNWAAFAIEHPADCIYCNDLPSLLAGVAHKLRYGSRLIYDAHEIYCDMYPGGVPRAWKQATALLEASLTWMADCVIGVSESHADWMRQTYQLARKVLCVPNCVGLGEAVAPPPRRPPGSPLRIYYHGASDPYRGLSKMVRGLALVSDVELVLRCLPSETLEEARQLAATLGISDRLRILPIVPADQMIEATRSEADVGIHAHEAPTALNIKVCLANKFIEYLLAGIPIITAPLQEQARIVRTYDVGYVLPDNSPEEIRRSFEWAKANRAQLAEMGQRAYRVGVERFSWPALRQTLAEAFGAIGPHNPGDALCRVAA